MELAAFVLMASGVLLYVITPLLSRHHPTGQTGVRENKRRQLLETRDRLYEAIRELDFDFRMGKVEPGDFEQTRAGYEARAFDLMKALDRLQIPDRAGAPADGPDDPIEAEIAAVRQARNKK